MGTELDSIVVFTLVIVAVGTLISAIMSVLTFFNSHKNSLELETVKKVIKEVEHNTNGIQDALVAAAKKTGYAEGRKDQADKMKEED